MPRGVAGKLRDPFASLPRQESRGFVPQSIGGAHDRSGRLREKAALFERLGGLGHRVAHEGRIRLRIFRPDHEYGRAAVFIRHGVAKRLHDVRGELRRLGRKETQKVRLEPSADGVREKHAEGCRKHQNGREELGRRSFRSRLGHGSGMKFLWERRHSIGRTKKRAAPPPFPTNPSERCGPKAGAFNRSQRTSAGAPRPDFPRRRRNEGSSRDLSGARTPVAD